MREEGSKEEEENDDDGSSGEIIMCMFLSNCILLERLTLLTYIIYPSFIELFFVYGLRLTNTIAFKKRYFQL